MKWIFLSIVFWFSVGLQGQDSTVYGRHLLFGIGVAPSIGLGDFGNKYKSFSSIPVTATYKTNKNVTFGLTGSGYFGQNILVPGIFKGMTYDDMLVDINGNPAAVRFQMRGWYAMATVGKIFSLKRPNLNKGIHLRFGAGFMQHKLRMQFDSEKVPQLEDAYIKGYDQLHNGLILMTSVQYHLISLRNLSLYAGIDYGHGFMKNRRSWEYSLNRRDDALKTDQYVSFNAGIIIPLKIYKSTEARYFE